jgi:hypothetical protein
MTNPYYSHGSGVPAAQTRGGSANVRAEFDLLQAAFDAVYAQVFNTALPGIAAGTAGMTVTNNGTLAAWQAITNIPWTKVNAATVAMTAGTPYAFIYASALVAGTLPPNPNEMDVVWVKVANGKITNTVDPGAKTIEGTSGVCTLDNQYGTYRWQYINSDWKFL